MYYLESFFRSLFISLFPFISLLVLGFTFVQLSDLGASLGYLSLMIISGTITAFFAGLFISPRARTDANLNIYSLIIAFGVLISIIGLFKDSVSLAQISILGILSICWILYLKWYSIFNNRTSEILQVGNKLVEFQLENSEKEQVSSFSFLASPTIFLFYRGNWCPLCMAQIKEIATQYKELEKLGVNTVLISPQPHNHTKTLANKYKLNFHFLVDHKNRIAKQLGIFVENGIPAGFQVLGYDSDTVMPTVIITNKEGKIIFVDLTDNYRVRPEPELFLEIIRESIQQPHLPNS